MRHDARPSPAESRNRFFTFRRLQIVCRRAHFDVLNELEKARHLTDLGAVSVMSDHHVARSKRRDEHMLDISAEDISVHRPVEDPGRVDEDQLRRGDPALMAAISRGGGSQRGGRLRRPPASSFDPETAAAHEPPQRVLADNHAKLGQQGYCTRVNANERDTLYMQTPPREHPRILSTLLDRCSKIVQQTLTICDTNGTTVSANEMRVLLPRTPPRANPLLTEC